eukprot:CAMPEP_0195525516 /NCGR_PEP_ID=MMETSP0794_2-20130614/25994_1 /TAXON_ID=515487 /ORGANISM="Stephanopyxis turris, Strain CCMP 815" /LENGTH=813 /DNA_ID=CAMNT_0040655995 /DNA_START=180 /DNA_END=2621 /DNA_ORIENTATION=-
MDRQALSRATESTDSPTPGYLYIDIAKNCAASPVAAREIIQFLTKRLSSKQSHNVKYKCLKVFAQVAHSPVTRGQFKREVCTNQEAVKAIKEALNFRGPPDPLRGDEIYERVRTAAKETLDAIYSDTPTPEPSHGGGGGGGGGMSSSYGSSNNYGGPVAGGSGGGGKTMEGIGNPMFKDPRLEQSQGRGIGKMTLGDVANVAKETVVGMIKDPLARNVNHSPPRPNQGMPGFGSNGSGGVGGGGYGAPTQSSYGNPPGRNELAQSTNGQWTMASNRGPNAIGPPSNYNSERDEAYFKARDAGSSAFQWAQGGAGGNQGAATNATPSHHGVGGSWATSAPSNPSVASQARQPPAPSGFAPPPGTTNFGSGGTAMSDGTYERNLIQELCPPGGMKAQPPEDKLNNFKRAVPSLNPDLICPVLLDCLEDGQPWIIRAKALCVMETTLQVSGGESNPYADFFHACLAEIEPLGTHARAAVRDPAKRVLKLLGVRPEDLANSPVRKKNTQPQPQLQPAPVEQQEPPADLLDFGTVDDPVPAPPQVAPAPAPPQVAPAPAPAASAGGGSLFGGLTVQKAASKEAPAPAPEAPPAPAPNTDANFLNETNQPKPANDGVEDLVNSTSAFSFIQASNSDPTPTNDELLTPNIPAPAPAPTPQPTETFDPLLSMGMSNTTPSLNTPNVNAAMQAQAQLAYQQNMMMMQQMQMAMMQQNRNMMPNQHQPNPRTSPRRSNSSPMSGSNSMQMGFGQGNMVAAPAGMQHQQGIMGSNSMRQIPIVQGKGNASGSGGFSFLDDPSQKKKAKDNMSFDFINDTMKSAK